MDASEAEEFSEVFSKPLRSLPYDSAGQIFVAFEKREGLPTAGKFSNILKFIVKEVLLVPFILAEHCDCDFSPLVLDPQYVSVYISSMKLILLFPAMNLWKTKPTIFL